MRKTLLRRNEDIVRAVLAVAFLYVIDLLWGDIDLDPRLYAQFAVILMFYWRLLMISDALESALEDKTHV